MIVFKIYIKKKTMSPRNWCILGLFGIVGCSTGLYFSTRSIENKYFTPCYWFNDYSENGCVIYRVFFLEHYGNITINYKDTVCDNEVYTVENTYWCGLVHDDKDKYVKTGSYTIKNEKQYKFASDTGIAVCSILISASILLALFCGCLYIADKNLQEKSPRVKRHFNYGHFNRTITTNYSDVIYPPKLEKSFSV